MNAGQSRQINSHPYFQGVHWLIVTLINTFSGGQDLALSQLTSSFLTPSMSQLPNCHESNRRSSLTCILTGPSKFAQLFHGRKMAWKNGYESDRSLLLLRWGGQVRCNCWRDARITSTRSNAGPTLKTRLSSPNRIFYRHFEFFDKDFPEFLGTFSFYLLFSNFAFR